MKSFTHMFFQSIRLLDTIFSSSKTKPHTYNMLRNCLQAGHVIFPCLFFRIPTHVQPITLVIFETGGHMTCVSSQLPHIPNMIASWSNNVNAFHREGVPRLLLRMHIVLVEYVNEGLGHTSYDLQYTRVIWKVLIMAS